MLRNNIAKKDLKHGDINVQQIYIIASALLLSKTLELTNVKKIAIDILAVHSLNQRKMAELRESDLLIPTQASPTHTRITNYLN